MDLLEQSVSEVQDYMGRQSDKEQLGEEKSDEACCKEIELQAAMEQVDMLKSIGSVRLAGES